MLSIARLFENWFDDPAISFTDLEAGTRDHLTRLRKGNDGGRFDQLITATEARYTAYFGHRSGAATAASTGKGTTVTLDAATDAMKQWLANDGYEAVHYHLKDEATRLRFYPNGTTEYHRATDGEWAGLLGRYGAAVQEFSAKLGPDTVAAYTERSSALLAALAAQAGQSQQRSAASAGSYAEREPLTLQLSHNARQLGIIFEKDPTQAATYFDAKYFNQHRPEPAAPAAQAGA